MIVWPWKLYSGSRIRALSRRDTQVQRNLHEESGPCNPYMADLAASMRNLVDGRLHSSCTYLVVKEMVQVEKADLVEMEAKDLAEMAKGQVGTEKVQEHCLPPLCNSNPHSSSKGMQLALVLHRASYGSKARRRLNILKVGSLSMHYGTTFLRTASDCTRLPSLVFQILSLDPPRKDKRHGHTRSSAPPQANVAKCDRRCAWSCCAQQRK